MNPEARKKLDEIVEKSLPALNEHDIRFLKARRSYLTPEQLEKFKEVLDKPLREGKAKDPLYISTKDLKKKAQALGINHRGKPREEIERAIDTVLGPENAPKPE